MLFIPQEVKDQIAELEAENKRLQSENAQLSQALSAPKPKSGSSIWVVIMAVALVAALAYIVYAQFFAPKPQQARPQENESAVVLRDGKIEKWNRYGDSEVVYRVQLGAYAEFNLDKYKQNLEGLYADSIDGLRKISLGAFSRLADAQAFQSQMVRLGLEDVYIVAYENKMPLGLIEAEKSENETVEVPQNAGQSDDAQPETDSTSTPKTEPEVEQKQPE